MSPAPVQLESGVFRIDTRFQGEDGVIASYLLEGGDGLALVETGPTSSVENLLQGVREAGHDPDRINRILVTHIHLDHAGACGTLAARLPAATVYVHPVGAPHLVDPSKLLASAARIYGDRMETLWGDVLPVPEERVVALDDGTAVNLGGRSLVALHTPGHAEHHLAFHDADSGTVYTGDVAGVRLGGAPYVRPPTPPPELHIERWRDSILRLRGLRPRRLCLTHFGACDDVEWHFDDLLARLHFWAGWVLAGVENGTPPDEMTARLRRLGDADIAAACGDPDAIRLYELATNYDMTVGGYLRYFRKREAGGRR